MRKINDIIVHCTATRENQVYTIEQLRKDHLARKFTEIGYHFIIDREGTIHNGRDIEKIGAHCIGHNKNSIGVCYIGGLDRNGKPKDTRTEEQRKALHDLICFLQEKHKATVHGHNDYASVYCPCFNVKDI